MDTFYGSFLKYCFLVFLFVTLAQSAPPDNELKDHHVKDHGYLGLQEKVIPKSDMILMSKMLKKLIHERPGENVQTSPVGAMASLMMLHLGAGEMTRHDLLSVMGLAAKDINPTELHKSFDEVLEKMEHQGHAHKDPSHSQMMEDKDKIHVMITNGFFVQKDHPFTNSYLDSLREYYSANATNLDFHGHAVEATDDINSWSSEKTHKRVEKFFQTPLPSQTTAVLTSTMYFHGLWQHPFDIANTKLEKFNTGSNVIDVPMMHNEAKVLHIHSDILQFDAIELLFKGGEFAMIISQPRPSQTIENVTEHLHLFDAKEINRNTKLIEVDYKIPKMKLFRKQSLVNALQLEGAFQMADLSPMVGAKLPISDMVQVTELEVDEHGVTPSGPSEMNNGHPGHRHRRSPGAEVKFHIERPYYASILHRPTHMIIFNSIIHNPMD